MDYNDRANILIKIIVPLMLIVCPVGVFVLSLAVIRESRKGYDPAVWGVAAIILLCDIGTLWAVKFCRTELGWFIRKRK
jgi:hypothetical protein